MRITSFRIAALGMLVQLSIGGLFIKGLFSNNLGGILLGTLGLYFALAAALAIPPLLLLYFGKTKKMGAILSIIIGFAGGLSQVGMFVGAFLVTAGIFYFAKKS